MISHHHKCIFVHLPKNAGQSIEHVFLNLLDLTWETRAPLLLRSNQYSELGPPRLAHLKAKDYVACKYVPQDMYNDYFKFGFVRNPWSRMVSFYKYLGFSHKYDFKSFLKGPFSDTVLKQKHWFVAPQSEYLYSQDGELLVDFVGRFERLQDDFDQVCDSIGLLKTPLPHINNTATRKIPLTAKSKKLASQAINKLLMKNIPKYQSYHEYYDQESIDLVAHYYKPDIELFNYDFPMSATQ